MVRLSAAASPPSSPDSQSSSPPRLSGPTWNELKSKMVKEGKNRMFVLKRDGREEPVHFDKITSRIQKLCYGLDMDYIDPPAITLKVD